jgi:hypothetical protein
MNFNLKQLTSDKFKVSCLGEFECRVCGAKFVVETVTGSEGEKSENKKKLARFAADHHDCHAVKMTGARPLGYQK